MIGFNTVRVVVVSISLRENAERKLDVVADEKRNLGTCLSVRSIQEFHTKVILWPWVKS